MLDPDDPVSIGAMVGPEAFKEVRYLAHAKLVSALQRVPAVADEFYQVFGRCAGGLVAPYRVEDAQTVVVAMGSVLGTLKDVARLAAREGPQGRRPRDHHLPPVPARLRYASPLGRERVVVVEKAFARGFGGVALHRRGDGDGPAQRRPS